MRLAASDFKALWNDRGLYVRFDAMDMAPWHTMTKRDEHLWDEEVVEIFLDVNRSGRNYAELEINPANVICDVLMISPSPDKKNDLTWNIDGLESRVTNRGVFAGGTEPRAVVPGGSPWRSCPGPGSAHTVGCRDRAAAHAWHGLALQRLQD